MNKLLGIQKEIAACSDELMSISSDIEKYVIPLYEQMNSSVLKIQCEFQIKRCRDLTLKLKEKNQELDFLLKGERRSGAEITRRIIEEDLVILEQNEELLSGILASSKNTEISSKTAEKLSDQTQYESFKTGLLKEAGKCRTKN